MSVFVIALLSLTLLGLLLRLWGIDLESLSHSEIYVPNIPLPDHISEPPPRHDFWFTVSWHFHQEPHPCGWYLAMMGWTEIFGTSHAALRLPSALLGAASIYGIGLLGRHIWSAQAGLIAAAMMSLHGFHIFWSQMARMYTAGVFFTILSAWLLLKLLTRKDRTPGLEIAYLFSCLAGIQSVELFWPILLMQIAWLSMITDNLPFRGWRASLRRPFSDTPRLLQWQSVIFMFALPSLAHSAYRARNNAAEPPSIGILQEYSAFGFLFSPDELAIPSLSIPLVAHLGLAVVALALYIRGLLCPMRPKRRTAGGQTKLPTWLVVAAFLISFGLILWFGQIAWRRGPLLLAMSSLVVVALYTPVIAALLRNAITAMLPAYETWRSNVPPAKLLLVLCGIVAPLTLFLLSFVVTLIAPRAWTVFVPFLLLLAAGGLAHILDNRRTVGAVALASVLAAFAASVPYSWRKPGSPNDFKGLAVAMKPEMQATDLVLVRERDWTDTPLFYYLQGANLVATDWEATLAAQPEARVWLISWPHEGGPVAPGIAWLAERGYKEINDVSSLRASARLFVTGETDE